jgi:hypothetical protein
MAIGFADPLEPAVAEDIAPEPEPPPHAAIRSARPVRHARPVAPDRVRFQAVVMLFPFGRSVIR